MKSQSPSRRTRDPHPRLPVDPRLLRPRCPRLLRRRQVLRHILVETSVAILHGTVARILRLRVLRLLLPHRVACQLALLVGVEILARQRNLCRRPREHCDDGWVDEVSGFQLEGTR